MNPKVWLTILAAAVFYVACVMVIGFEGPMALAINFGRVALAVAVLILYMPALGAIFRAVPAPSRDYLLAGIILTWLSAFTFSVSNEAGRIFGWNTSIFTNPFAGFFSFLLVTGGVFHLLAPDTGDGRSRARIIAVAIGIAVGVAVVFVAPLFR